MHHLLAVRSGFAATGFSMLATALLALSSGQLAAAETTESAATALYAGSGSVVNSPTPDGVVLIGQQQSAFPYHINRPGSYRLASNLRVPAGESGIVITANNVTLDLNGFAVLATGTCGSITCQVVGIDVRGSSVTVKNGSVSGFSTSVLAGVGVSIGAGTGILVEEVHLAGNDTGILTAGDTIVRRCTLESNQTNIFVNGKSSIIEGNAISGIGTQGTGIAVFAGGATLTGNSMDNLPQAILVYGPNFSGSGHLLYSQNIFEGDGVDITNGGGIAMSTYNNLCSDGSRC
jgi:hypothetical protein